MPHVPQQKTSHDAVTVLHAAARTQCSQVNRYVFFKERQYNLTTRLHIRGLCFESCLFVCLGFGAAGIPAEGNLNKRAFFSGEQIPLLAQGELLGQIVWVMV